MVLEKTQKALIIIWEEENEAIRVLYLVQPGFTVIAVTYCRGDFEIRVFEAVNTREGLGFIWGKKALREQYTFSRGVWVPEVPNGALLEEVEEAKQRAICYRCPRFNGS